MKITLVAVLKLIFSIFSFLIASDNSFSQAERVSVAKGKGAYQCLPCGNECDNSSFTQTGKCPHCQMPLVKKATIRFKEISPADICNYISSHSNTILLDVRTREEFEEKADPNFGVLKNSINIPVQELETRIGEINHLKKKEIIVYCSHSHRSPRASYILTQHGFRNVINMSGGMSVMKDKACIK
ncbi:MAG: rhodanese-like domain-containing protein [Bacteroidetes bacterium]|nr:rhodanese-like domain-containing protein [Bacteroidota bacterium]